MLRFALLSIGLAALTLAGCEKLPADAPIARLVPFSALVLVDGKPAAGVQVILHSMDGTVLGAVTPHGLTDADGRFELTTYTPADGAPEGVYRVTATWTEILNPGKSDPEFGPEKLPRRYQSPETSGLDLEVRESAVGTPTLELKSR